MNRLSLPRGISRRATVLVVSMLVSACGVPADPSGSDDNAIELTFVGLNQYNTPVLLTASDQPPVHRVTIDVTIVFRFASQLETLVVDFESPRSGRATHNEIDLGALAPGIAAATEGRWEIRAPLTIPELGTLRFSVTLLTHDGTMSRAVDGSFTVQSALGADDTSQTQATQVGTTTQSVDP